MLITDDELELVAEGPAARRRAVRRCKAMAKDLVIHHPDDVLDGRLMRHSGRRLLSWFSTFKGEIRSKSMQF